MPKAIVKKAAKPATKSTTPAKKAVAKIVKKPAAAPVKRSTAPAVKAPSTVISAQIDIGFGNTLYIRGEGPGLSWDVGVALESVSDDLWSITLPAKGKPVVFKFLVNDVSWSVGDDYIVESGAKISLVPVF